jgi:SulP family sulfate permease
MFFGTVNQLDSHIQKLLSNENYVKYVVLDFSLISGVDYSGVETFVRIKKHLEETKTHLVFCELNAIETALRETGIFDLDDNVADRTFVHIFESINDALEWCENSLLESYFKKSARSPVHSMAINRSAPRISITNTPRRTELNNTASVVMRSKYH